MKNEKLAAEAQAAKEQADEEFVAYQVAKKWEKLEAQAAPVALPAASASASAASASAPDYEEDPLYAAFKKMTLEKSADEMAERRRRTESHRERLENASDAERYPVIVRCVIYFFLSL